MELSHKKELISANEKVERHMRAHRLEEALELAKKNIDLIEPVENEPVLYSMQLQILGAIYMELRKFGEAGKVIKKCYEIRKDHFAPNHPVMGTTLRLMGLICYYDGNIVEARKYVDKAIDTWKRSLPPDHSFIKKAKEDMDVINGITKHQRVEEAHTAYEEAIKNLGVLNFQSAETLFKKSIEINQNQLGFTHTDVAGCMVGLAGLYGETGRNNEAITVLREAVFIAKINKRDNIHVYAYVLSEYANALKTQNRYTESRQIFEEILSLNDVLHADQITSVKNNYSTLLSLLGNKKESIDIIDSIIENINNSETKDQNLLVIAIANKASVFSDMGRVRDAFALYTRALEIKEELYGKKHPSYAKTLINIATLHSNNENIEESTRLLETAKDIYFNYYGRLHPDYVRCLLLISGCLVRNGSVKRALELNTEALSIVKTISSNNIVLISKIEVDIALLSGDSNSINQGLRKKIDLVFEAYGHQSLDICEARLQLARSILFEKIRSRRPIDSPSYTEIETLLKAVQDSLQSMNVAGQNFANSFSLLAILYMYQGLEQKAFEMIAKAITVIKPYIAQVFSIASENVRIKHTQTIGYFLDLYLSIVTYNKSISKYEDAITHLNHIINLKNIIVDIIAGERLILKSSFQEEDRETLKRIHDLRAMIAEKMIAGQYFISPEQENEITEWIREKEKLEANVAFDLSYQNTIESLLNESVKKIQELMPVASGIIEIVEFNDHSVLWDLNSDINTYDEDILSHNRHKYIICLIKKDVSPLIIELKEHGQINATIEQYIAHIATQEVSSNTIDPITDVLGKRLKAKIWNPVLEYLQEIRSVFICPDGAFWNFPFESIPSANGGFIVDEYDISYLSSLRDVIKTPAIYPSSQCIVVADPDFDYTDAGYPRIDETESRKLFESFRENEMGGMSITYNEENPNIGNLNLYESLKGTRGEGEKIATLLNARRIFGNEVKEVRIKEFKSPGILHFATHGFFFEHPGEWNNINLKRATSSKTINFDETNLLMNNLLQEMRDSLSILTGNEDETEGLIKKKKNYEEEKNNPMLCSGLVLAGANTWMKRGSLPPEYQDCHLLAEDILTMNLLGTQLVVLSACESAKTILRRHAGVYGMRRAFTLAGAETLIMSLWKVPDEHTREFMEIFYEKIIEKVSRIRALTDTKLIMKEKYKNPFYWAGFILQGKTEKLTGHIPLSAF